MEKKNKGLKDNIHGEENSENIVTTGDLGDVHKASKSFSEVWLFIWETMKIVIISLVIIIPIRYYIAQPFFVRGASMEPTFEDNDYLIIDEISYRFNEPQRGDVIVFRFPDDPKEFYIKRILGLPNETIDIKDNKVFIFNKDNPTGFVLDESIYLDPEQKTNDPMRIKLDENEYFVMGDNRLASSDSRRWGPLNKYFITGKVFVRAWPINKIERFEVVEYSNPEIKN